MRRIGAGRNLQADRRPPLPREHGPLDRFEHVVGLVALDGNVGVAGDAEEGRGRDLRHRGRARPRWPRSRLPSGPGGRRRPAGGPSGKSAAERASRRSARSPSALVSRDGDVPLQSRQPRRRMQLLDRQRREHGQDLLAEIGRQGNSAARRSIARPAPR